MEAKEKGSWLNGKDDYNKEFEHFENLDVISETITTKIEDWKKELNGLKIDVNKKLQPPEVVWKIKVNGKLYNCGTRENFSVIIGKAKSKKSFSLTLFLADYLKFQKNKNVIYFDTEQSEYHVQKAINRLSVKNGSVSTNIEAYHLRSKETAKRLELIEKAIYNTENLELVIIDGIRDLVTSINDESEATMITSKLMKWTEERKIHIITILHQNKGDNNARGHVGTELMNKAELVLSVTKDEVDKNISIIQTVASRDLEIEEFAFQIDENGIPNIIEEWKKQSTSFNTSNKKAQPHEIAKETYQEILNVCFAKKDKLKHSELVHQLQLSIQKLTGIDFATERAKKVITHLLNIEMIEQRGTPKTSASHYVNTSNEINEVKGQITPEAKQSKIEL